MNIRIPKVKNLITARPEGMDFETYKLLRKAQKELLHGHNEIVMTGGTQHKVHYPGRLDGVAFRPEQWTNSRDCKVIIG